MRDVLNLVPLPWWLPKYVVRMLASWAIEAAVRQVKKLMEKDLKMGYALQVRISQIYFNRYIDSMQKLQAIVMNIPIESA